MIWDGNTKIAQSSRRPRNKLNDQGGGVGRIGIPGSEGAFGGETGDVRIRNREYRMPYGTCIALRIAHSGGWIISAYMVDPSCEIDCRVQRGNHLTSTLQTLLEKVSRWNGSTRV